MTVKSPFYNKPSTATSVDSCHKCPLLLQEQAQDSNAVPNVINQQVQPKPAGFEQLQVTSPSNSNTSVAEPCSSSAAKPDNGNVPVTSCSNCGTTSTPLWRRSPQGETICNACGLYLKARNTIRPPWLKRNSTKRPTTPHAPVALAPAPPTVPTLRIAAAPASAHSPATATAATTATPTSFTSTADEASTCSTDCADDCQHRSTLCCNNCNTTTTPLWRRDEQGNTICNACGLYYKLHNVHRPMTMKRAVIKRRKRVTVSSLAAQHNNNNNNMVHTHVAMDENDADGRKRKLSFDDNGRPAKRTDLPTLAAKVPIRPLLPHQPPVVMALSDHRPSLDPMEPDAFRKARYHPQLPSPPMKPVSSGKASDIARLLNPTSLDTQNDKERALPALSLPSLPSPPMTAHEMPPLKETPNSSAIAAAAALATVSALLNPTANPLQTHQMLEAHRCELQREVSLLTRTTAMLQNLDQVMAVTGQTKLCA